jgi:hypothetical protein
MFQNKFIALFLFIPFLFLIPKESTAQGGPLNFLADSVSYLWPTDASRQLSSTFAETRSAHLHSGIDIRTWGREGYQVFASRDGLIYRIAIGPHGYGHVIYMKHNDDSYTVYAHLNRFEPKLQAFADSIRLIGYTYEIDKLIEEVGFYFEKGDVIGYTGSTGVGPPHLHFEIRDPEFKPVNPLLTNLTIQDDLPPVFSQLAVEFLHSETLKRTGHRIIPVTTEGGTFDFGEISVSGPVGLAVNVHDRANNTPNLYAVHSLKMIVESDTLFHSKADYFSFRNGRNMFLDRSYPILAQTRRGYQRLYVVEGNQLPFYKKKVNQGVLDLPKGTHFITIVAKDIFGNESRATLNLMVESGPSLDQISYVPTYPFFETISDLRLHRWKIGEIPFTKSLLASSATDMSFMPERGLSHYFSINEKTSRKTLIPNTFETLATSDQKLWLQFPSVALYDTLEIKMSVIEQANQIDISFNPSRLPVGSTVDLNFILPENFKNRDHLALFSVDHYRGRESFIRSDISNGILRARINEIADLRLKEDRIAPWVGTPRIEKNLAGNHIVVVPAVDRDTGINFRRSTILVNGQRGIIEYDPEKNFLIFYHPDFKPQQQNKISFKVYDGVGNLTEREVNISFRN